MLSVCPLFIRHCMLRSFAPAAGPPSGSCWLAAGSLACLLAGMFREFGRPCKLRRWQLEA